MKPILPIKNLLRLNWILIATFSAIVFLFMFFLLEETQLHKLLYAVMTAIAMGLVALTNLVILVVLSRRFNLESRKFRWYRYFLSYAASATIYLTLSPVFDFISNKSYMYSHLVYLCIFASASLVVNTVVIVLHDFVILQSKKAQADLEVSNLKTAHAEAANLLLKQQIHPHFLFNALNTLKSLYRKDPSAGDTYIIHLASFLRASVYSHSSKVSKLEDELILLSDYLQMQKIRFGTALFCFIEIPEEVLKTSYLPSFSLQPLLENAIKHNELTLEAPLEVYIEQKDQRIIVRNNLQKKKVIVPSAHHGLANLAERYRLLSNDEVYITECERFFSVSIKLLQDEYSDY